jgi:hypothetical protein
MGQTSNVCVRGETERSVKGACSSHIQTEYDVAIHLMSALCKYSIDGRAQGQKVGKHSTKYNDGRYFNQSDLSRDYHEN